MAAESRGRYWILAFGPLVLAGVVSYYLWRDFQEDAVIGRNSVRVASILKHEGIVKRRPDDRFRWFKVSVNKAIFAGDSLSTGAGAKLGLEFPDGTLINLGENTLFTLEKRDNGGVAINVSTGSFSYKAGTKKTTPGAAAAPAPRVESQGKTLDISKSEGTVDMRDGAVSVNVTKGTAAIQNGSVVDKVDAGKALESGSDGTIRRGDLSFKQINPAKDSVIQAPMGRPDAPVDFEWQQPAPGPLKLEISSVLSFSKGWQSFPINGSQQLRITLPTGRYFWRLTDSKGNGSPTSTFEIVADDGIRLLEPPAEASIAANNGGTDIPIVWEAGNRSDTFRVLIASDPDFRKIAYDNKVQGASKTFANLKGAGRFYWKIEGTTSRKPSDVRQFTLVASAPLDTAASSTAAIDRKPFELLAPKPASQILLGTDRDGERQKQRVQFTWKAPTPQKATVFKLFKVDSHGNSSTVVERQITGKTPPSINWVASELGSFRWEITSENYFSRSDFKVAPANLSIETPSATIVDSSEKGRADRRLIKRDLVLQLDWKAVPGAQNYRIVFSRDPEFQSLEMEREVAGLSTKVVSKDFLYSTVYYRVETTTKDGQEIMSAPGKFAFKLQPPLPKTPNDRQTISRTSTQAVEGEAVIFSWQHTTFGTEYLFELSTTSDFRTIAQKSQTKDNFYIARGLSLGPYYWRVRSVRLPLMSDPSPTRTLRISR